MLLQPLTSLGLGRAPLPFARLGLSLTLPLIHIGAMGSRFISLGDTGAKRPMPTLRRTVPTSGLREGGLILCSGSVCGCSNGGTSLAKSPLDSPHSTSPQPPARPSAPVLQLFAAQVPPGRRLGGGGRFRLQRAQDLLSLEQAPRETVQERSSSGRERKDSDTREGRCCSDKEAGSSCKKMGSHEDRKGAEPPCC